MESSKRLEFQTMHAVAPILNIGCGEDPCNFADNAVHLDIDVWKYGYFVHADAYDLPFRDGAFMTCILGDVLEHLVEPRQALREAKRVGKQIILTIFEEWRLGGRGKHLYEGKKLCLPAVGYEPYIGSRCVKIMSEDKISHVPHIWQFTDEDIEEMMGELNMRILIYGKVPEAVHDGHQWYNWLILLSR